MAAIVNRKGIGADDAEFNSAFRRMKADVLKAMDALKDETSRAKLLKALAASDAQAVADAIPWNQLNGHLDSLKTDIREIFEVEARLAAEGVGIVFDIFNPRALDWVGH